MLRTSATALVLLSLTVGAMLSVGCSRTKYRQAADRSTYSLLSSRNTDFRWLLPSRQVEPVAESRLSVPANLDCAPKPPDDPAAAPWMYCPDGHSNEKYWSSLPDAGSIESHEWIERLPRQADGTIQLTQQSAVDLALLHSRDYQTRYETVYLNALALTGNEFEFDTQWHCGIGTQFTATGKDLGNNKLLQVSDRLGFSRNLAGGGQIATDVVNSFFWDFGTNSIGSSGLLVSSFTQPLLRGAFRHVRLENLTQAERNLLYQVRDFARFRRQLYADMSARYLRLLTQKQSIRNAQSNIESLRINLVEHQEMRALKMVAQIQVDQIFQEYQNGRLTLLAAEQDLVSAQDDFKFQMGLPPWIQFDVDEGLLERFELSSPELQKLDQEVQQLYLSLLQFTPTESMRSEAAPLEFLQSAFEQYLSLHNQLDALAPQVATELQQWQDNIAGARHANLSEDDLLDLRQQAELANRISKDLKELQKGLANRQEYDQDVRKKLEAYNEPVPSPSIDELTGAEPIPSPVAAWQSLYEAISGPLREEIASLTIYQTQIRLFLIDVKPVGIEQQVAVTYAHQNRLDQMNRQAAVMDAFRKIEVAANSLKSSLALNGQVGLGTDPSKNNAFRLDSSANTYRTGVQFDGPLNRLNERNTYRATQIAYQQAARNYSSGRDSIANEIRASLRQIELRRLNFQIARQQLVAASRQVDQAQINIRTATASSTNLTRDLLQSLQGLLAAKNNLISNWIEYKILRIRIFASLELLYMDDNGVWINEDFDLAQLKDLISQSDYFLDIPAPARAANESALNLEAENPLGEPAASNDSASNSVEFGPVISLAPPPVLTETNF